MRRRSVLAMALFLFTMLAPNMAHADLDRMCRKLGKAIADHSDNATIHCRFWDFTVMNTGKVPRLSKILYNKTRYYFSEEGLRFSTDRDNASQLLTGTFRREGKYVHFLFEIAPSAAPEQPRPILKYRMKASEVPKGSLQESLTITTEKIAGKLMSSPEALRSIMTRSQALRVLMGSLVDGQGRFSPPFARDLMAKLRSAMLQQDMVTIVMPGRDTTRGLRRKANSVGNLKGSGAVMGDADAVLEGTMRVKDKTVHLDLLIRTKDGTVVGSTTEMIPLSLSSLPVTDPNAVMVSTIADTAAQPGAGEVIRVSADKPGRHPVYRKGETLHLTVMTTQPLYIYLFDINPEYGIQPLYPLPGEPELLVSPGKPYLIPPIEVTPPYGLDGVKVFASTKPLGAPALNGTAKSLSFKGQSRGLKRKKIQTKLAEKTVINPMDLVDYYRGRAAKAGARLYEDTVYITTKDDN